MAAISEKAIENFAQRFLALGDAIESWAKALRPIAILAIPRRLKRSDETWNEYLARVPDALDDPVTRWEYQKWIWGYPLRLTKRLMNKWT